MGEQGKENHKLMLSAAGILIICLSLVTLIGFFGSGGSVGRGLAAVFKALLGELAWVGPFFTGFLGVYLITYRPVDKPEKPKQFLAREREKIHKDKEPEAITNKQAFKQFFADDDPLDEKKPQPEPLGELAEVGNDLNTYFGSSGNRKPTVRLASVGQHFTDYFADDDDCPQPNDEPTLVITPEKPVGSTAQKTDSQTGFQAFVNQRIHSEQEDSPSPVQPVLKVEEPTVHSDVSSKPVVDQLKFEVVEPQPLLNPIPDSETVVKNIVMPPLRLLDSPVAVPAGNNTVTEQNAELLEEVLNNFGVKVKVTEISHGPAITRYEVQPAPGIKISRIVNLADDIALALAAPDIRIEAPIPGKSAVGIEVPNKQVSAVKFREVLESADFLQGSKLKVALGKDIAGKPVVADLSRMPHLLVAGATGSGKSVCMNAIITSILYKAKPDEVKFLLVDPKMVELTKYNGIPHLVAPVVTDPKKAAAALRWVVNEMETRYELFAAAGVRDISRYNELKADQKPLPFVVVLIDELADLMMVAPGDVEEAICRLAQMARAAGIHLVIATQRPSVDVITGIIKANIPSRIAFAVSSQIDSRTILDSNGAEKLLGKGDMLYYPLGMAKPLRVQGCFLTDLEVEKVVNHWKEQAKPEYLNTNFEAAAASEEDAADDELFVEAARLFITTGMASVSLLQRRLRVGYTRAARLMDLLEQKGVVGGFEGSKPRQVLMSMEDFTQLYLEQE